MREGSPQLGRPLLQAVRLWLLPVGARQQEDGLAWAGHAWGETGGETGVAGGETGGETGVAGVGIQVGDRW